MSTRSVLAERLGLEPHPEGGWFRETWRSAVGSEPEGLATATTIYLLLHPGEESRWHTARSDELWFWHEGGPLELRLGGVADTPGTVEVVVLGGDPIAGHQPLVRVPGGVWQSAVPAGAEPVLVSCVVAPGFEYEDLRLL